MPYPVLPITYFFFSSPPFSEAYLEFSFPLPLLLLLFSSSLSLSLPFNLLPSASSSSFLSSFWSDLPGVGLRFVLNVFLVSFSSSLFSPSSRCLLYRCGSYLASSLVSPRLTSTFAPRQFHRTFLFLLFRFRIISLCLVSVFKSVFYNDWPGGGSIHPFVHTPYIHPHTHAQKRGQSDRQSLLSSIIYLWETLVLSICGDGLFSALLRAPALSLLP